MEFFLCEQQGKLVILQGYSQESGNLTSKNGGV